VELFAGESGVAPGQACVLYDGEGEGARVLGGGFIDRTERVPEAERMLARLETAMVEAG
jgi:tRNA-specific 2-thiouridylase